MCQDMAMTEGARLCDDIYRLCYVRGPEGIIAGSAFAARGSHGPSVWYRDVQATPLGALGWISGDRDDYDGLWRVSLMYETRPGNSKLSRVA
jgi:hypothetical protein